MAAASQLTLPPISELFKDPFSASQGNVPPDKEEQGSKCEVTFRDARINAKGDRIYLNAGTKRTFDALTDSENQSSALVLTRFYDKDGSLEYVETEIRSPHIKKALQQVVKSNYPGMNLSSEKLVTRDFKQCMFHYHKQLREYGKTLDDDVAARHIDLALQHLYKELDYEMQIFKYNVESENADPRLDFRNLWMAFCPGDLVVRKIRDIHCVYRLVRTSFSSHWLYGSGLFTLTLQSLDCNGDSFGYQDSTSSISENRCIGFTRLKDLPIIPLRYLQQTERDPIMKSTLARGKRFVMLSSGIHHCEYHGMATMVDDEVNEEYEHRNSVSKMVIRTLRTL